MEVPSAGASEDGAILHWLKVIYQDRPEAELGELATALARRIKTGAPEPAELAEEPWDQGSCLLISYGDTIADGRRAPLACLADFVSGHLGSVVDAVHILPFFPATGDDGFSVLDYRAVDPRIGAWQDITALSKNYRVMADAVLNHGSRSSRWFRQFVDQEAPGKDYYLTVAEDFDISQVVRPRAHPLLQPVETAAGRKQVWCTFSPDQVDFDFSNPRLLEEFLHIMLDFLDHGVRILRLDAVGFLWKESGTSCLNLPQTHAIIKLIRQITDLYCPQTIIVTETNLPNQENLSYFGNGNEAHWIYNFPLPPLILHSLLMADATILRRWSMSMPPALEGTSYLNFLSSHDGFGMRPTEGLLDETQRQALLDRLADNGSLFSWRSVGEGKKTVYEANITLYSALEKTDRDPQGTYRIERFIAAYCLIFGLEGIPAIYLNSFIGAENDLDGVARSGLNRRINRQKFDQGWLEDQLADKTSRQARILNRVKELLALRARQPAFHPNAVQFTLQLHPGLFGVWRQSRDRKQSIFAITNLQPEAARLHISEINLIDTEAWGDLIAGTLLPAGEEVVTLTPYQTVWITNHWQDGAIRSD